MSNKSLNEKLKQLCIKLINWLKYIKLKTVKSREIKGKYAHNHLLYNFHLNNDLHNKIKTFWKKYGIKVNTLWCRAWISVMELKITGTYPRKSSIPLLNRN